MFLALPLYTEEPTISVLGIGDYQYSLNGSGENNSGYISSTGNENHVIDAGVIRLNSLSNPDFFEWLRGLIDAEGCFYIQPIDNHFKFVFEFCLHIYELPLLKYLLQR